MFGRRLPAQRRPPLAPHERILAWARLDEGDVVVTNLGVWLPGRTRLDWHRIHRATWSGETLTIVPASVVAEHPGYAVMADEAPVSVRLPEPGDVPYQVRVRVTRSVGPSMRHRLPGGGVRVAARRVSGVDGLRWTVRYDPGVDPSDPSVVAQTQRLVESARGDV